MLKPIELSDRLGLWFIFLLKVDNFSDCVDGGFNVILRVKGTDADPNRPSDLRGAQLFMHQGGAMKSGSAGDIVLAVQKGAHIECLHSVYIEADDSDVIGQIILAVE